MNATASQEEMKPLLKVENLLKSYTNRTLTGHREEVRALHGVSFSLLQGTTLALVGESGSGKSTLALCLACLEKPNSGDIWFEGTDVVKLEEEKRRTIRRQIQLIFQDPANSFNPGWTVLEILTEPLQLQRNLSCDEMRLRAHLLLEQVGLSAELGEKLSSELSGGQRQRLAIARALTLEPKLLILDEALSALDCSVQAQIVNLLLELQSSRGLTYLYITHDLSLVGHLADEMAVMQRGRIVERASARELLRHPQHAHTRALVAAVPRLETLTPGQVAP